jgi:3-oxoacyl-[acyl-carrier protein] reductase
MTGSRNRHRLSRFVATGSRQDRGTRRPITARRPGCHRPGFPGLSLYAMSKTALIGLTKALGRELGGRAITVNLVNPGPTDTDLNPADGPNADTINGFTALGHYAAPADVAAAVVFLASPDGRYITGATINVDGGFTI